ncbi:winged helix-turn-helix domain-containing protein [Enterococcus rotai]|uniref:winged helix-turn-helix domain-containing protein n=1 Tax=Enterococcus rotai TaxID=118060 RepID=UPI0032B39232
MQNIGLYHFENPSSSYIDVLKEKKYTLLPLEKNMSEAKRTELQAIILDYSGESLGESVGQISEMLFTIKKSEMPFVFILLRESTQVERLIYLQLGATIVFDQHIKPREFGEIISNVLHQKAKADQPMVPEKEENQIQLNDHNHSICLENGKEISLTRLEYRLVSFLKEKQGKGATYEEIYQNLWDREIENKRYQVANLVFHIRTKIEENTAKPKYLKTIRTIGYALVQESTQKKNKGMN